MLHVLHLLREDLLLLEYLVDLSALVLALQCLLLYHALYGGVDVHCREVSG